MNRFAPAVAAALLVSSVLFAGQAEVTTSGESGNYRAKVRIEKVADQDNVYTCSTEVFNGKNELLFAPRITFTAAEWAETTGKSGDYSFKLNVSVDAERNTARTELEIEKSGKLVAAPAIFMNIE
jgi:hypothetical protein